MIEPILSAPTPEDAAAWFDFVVEGQGTAYAGMVPPDFAARQGRYRNRWVPALAASFADPGTASRVVAKADGVIIGLASIVDAPQPWEAGAGYVPAPASRQLERLYVAPRWHGRGLGSRLLERADDDRGLYLWLIDGNAAAQAYYRRRGFVDLDESFLTDDSWGTVGMHRMLRS